MYLIKSEQKKMHKARYRASFIKDSSLILKIKPNIFELSGTLEWRHIFFFFLYVLQFYLPTQKELPRYILCSCQSNAVLSSSLE